jgi:hypothetical protein
MSDHVPDSPTSVSSGSSGPRSPQYSPHDEDFTVPYWGCYWVAHEERTARYLIELREHNEAHAAREAVWRLAWLGLLDEEIARRYAIESREHLSRACKFTRKRGLHP